MITKCNIIYKAFERKYVAFNSVIAYQFDRDFLFSTFMKKCYQPCVTLGGKHLLWIKQEHLIYFIVGFREVKFKVRNLLFKLISPFVYFMGTRT
jgi:hypothetical protein